MSFFSIDLQPGAKRRKSRSMARAALLAFLIASLAVPQSAQQAPPPLATHSTTLLQAVQSALVNHPLLHSQQMQVEIARGIREQSSSIFDPVFRTSLAQNALAKPLAASQQPIGQTLLPNENTNETLSQVGSTELFRNGIQLSQSFQMDRNVDNLVSPRGLNTSDVNLLITIPLLRGRGRKATAAQEEAAKTEVDVDLYEFNQLASQLMSNAASSYWDMVAARQILAITRDAEERGKTYLESVQALIEADQSPRNDLNEVMANLAQRSSNRLAAEQAVVAAQQQLALDMGMSPQQMIARAPEPRDKFPDSSGQPLPANDSESLRFYLDAALQNRGDYLAAKRRIDESHILLTAARNRLLPQLDLNFGAGYSGLAEGRAFTNVLTSSYGQVPGPNVTAGITYSFSKHNRAASGALRQANATARQVDLQSEELARNISSNVVTSVEAVRNAAFQVEKAHSSVESFQSSLAGEREKYRVGMGSVINILTVEDKLTSAMTDEVQAQLAYALALTQFRFATGTLIHPNQKSQDEPETTFITLPFAGAPAR
jgi:outer membrane protein